MVYFRRFPPIGGSVTLLMVQLNVSVLIDTTIHKMKNSLVKLHQKGVEKKCQRNLKNC